MNTTISTIETILKTEFPTNFNTINNRGNLFSSIYSREPEQKTIMLSTSNTVKYYGWGDGAGNSLHLWTHEGTGKALMTFFDHESNLNCYAMGDENNEAYIKQHSLYDGVLGFFFKVLTNQEETHELFNIVDTVTGDTLYYASGVLTFDGRNWEISEGYKKALLAEPNEDGGFKYLTKLFTLNNYDYLKEGLAGEDEPDYVLKAFDTYEAAENFG